MHDVVTKPLDLGEDLFIVSLSVNCVTFQKNLKCLYV